MCKELLLTRIKVWMFSQYLPRTLAVTYQVVRMIRFCIVQDLRWRRVEFPGWKRIWEIAERERLTKQAFGIREDKRNKGVDVKKRV